MEQSTIKDNSLFEHVCAILHKKGFTLRFCTTDRKDLKPRGNKCLVN